jgi:hypothetical protein
MAETFAELEDARRAVERAEQDLDAARLRVAVALRTLHAGGMTFTALGRLLGVSRQRAKQLSER